LIPGIITVLLVFIITFFITRGKDILDIKRVLKSSIVIIFGIVVMNIIVSTMFSISLHYLFLHGQQKYVKEMKNVYADKQQQYERLNYLYALIRKKFGDDMVVDKDGHIFLGDKPSQTISIDGNIAGLMEDLGITQIYQSKNETLYYVYSGQTINDIYYDRGYLYTTDKQEDVFTTVYPVSKNWHVFIYCEDI